MNKGIAITAVVIVLAIVGILVFNLTFKGGTKIQPPTDTTKNEINQMFNASQLNLKIQNFAFSPSTITINKGDTITWTNADSAPHTVTSDSGSELNSGTINNGGVYSHTFNTAGTYKYHCAFHTSMKATVIVQ